MLDIEWNFKRIIWLLLILSNIHYRNFPGGPVSKTPSSNAECPGSVLNQGPRYICTNEDGRPHILQSHKLQVRSVAAKLIDKYLNN